MSITPTALWTGRAVRFGFGAAAIGVMTLAGIARNKWFALHLQPDGIGVIGQVVATHTWLGALAGLGLAIPLARRVGRAVGDGDADGVRRSAWTALTLVATGMVVVTAIGLLFPDRVAGAVLGDATFALLVQISMIGATGYALNGWLQGVYAGHSDVRPPLTMAIAGGTISVAAALLLVPRYGLAGGVFSAAVFFPAGIAAVLIVHRSLYTRTLLPRPAAGVSPHIARDLLVVGLAALAISLADQGALLALRSHFIRVNGLDANGLFQASLAISQQVGAPFYAYLANYAFGLVSGAAGVEAIREYMRKVWIPVVLAAFAAFTAAMLFASPLLHLLYSDRFDPARGMMVWMLFGEFCRVLSVTWSVSALPLRGKRLWLTIGMAYPGPLVIAYLAYFATAGQLSLPFACATAGLSSLLVASIGMSRAGVTLRARDHAVTITCIAALGILATRLAG